MSHNKYLIDTHVFLWAVGSSDLLSKSAKKILSDKTNEIYLSKVSYWEICLKISKGKLILQKGWEKKLEEERRANRFHWLEVAPKHCEGIISMPRHHKDPFDRLLLSQAKCEKLGLISCDEKLHLYNVKVYW
jgi:PIN domain nuclease of toxin-antitoxin system